MAPEIEARFERIETNLIMITDAQRRQTESLAQVTETMGRMMDTFDARMSRMEQNLELLIRAITAEHQNGKTGPG